MACLRRLAAATLARNVQALESARATRAKPEGPHTCLYCILIMYAPGLAGARGRSGRGAPKSGAHGWGAGRSKNSGALRLKTVGLLLGLELANSSSTKIGTT